MLTYLSSMSYYIFVLLSFLIYVIVLLSLSLSFGRFIVLFITGLIFQLIGGFIVIWFLKKSINRRREGIQNAFYQMAEGDLRFEKNELFELTQSKTISLSLLFLGDVLHRMIIYFLSLSQEIHKASRSILKISQGLLKNATEQLNSSETTSFILEEIHKSISLLHNSIEKLSVASEETASSILEMSASIEESAVFAKNLNDFVQETINVIEENERALKNLSSMLEEISSSAVETSSSMIEMNATISEVEKRAITSAKIAHETLDSARKGQEAVETSVQSVNEMQAVISETLNTIKELGLSSKEIGEIIRVIEQITSQTNLLALNAAIIAAQAKEKGKGFAVVADEIRDLSERTYSSTGEISKLISNVQKRVESALDAMQKVTERVQISVEKSLEARNSLEIIFKYIEKFASSMDEISRSTQEQSKGSEQVTLAMENITNMIQNMAREMESISKISSQTTAKSLHMKESSKQILKSLDEQLQGSKAISKAVEDIQKSINNLIQVSKQLKSGTYKILDGIDLLHKVNMETSASAQILASTAEKLDSESLTMKNRISSYKLPEPIKGGSASMHLNWRGDYIFDPITSTYIANNYIIHNIFDTLLTFGSGLNILNTLAEELEITNFGKTYLIYLKSGVTFHNGKTMDSEDVKASFLRILHPSSPSHAKWIFTEVEGAEEFRKGRKKDVPGIEVIDKTKLKIHLRQPLSYFSSLLALGETSIVPKEFAENFSSFGLNPVGSGPFLIEEVVKENYIKLKKYSNYYDGLYPNLDELVFSIQPITPMEKVNRFLEGKLDILTDFPLSKFEDLKKESIFYVPVQALKTIFIGINQAYEPLKDLRVRKALNYAINKERINQEFFGGYYQIARGILPPNILGHSLSAPQYSYSPEEAKKLLKEAGFGGGLTLSLWHPSTEKAEDTILPYIIDDLSKVGIDLEVSFLPPEEIQTRRREKKRSALFLTQWLADFPHPDNFFSNLFYSKTDLMQLHYFNPEFDNLVEKARFVQDSSLREEMYQNLDRMIIEDAAVIFLFYSKDFIFYKPQIQNLIPYLSPPPIRFKEIWVEE